MAVVIRVFYCWKKNQSIFTTDFMYIENLKCYTRSSFHVQKSQFSLHIKLYIYKKCKNLYMKNDTCIKNLLIFIYKHKKDDLETATLTSRS